MKRNLLIIFAGLLLSGCATIMSGTSQVVSINSEPQGASVSTFTKHGQQILCSATPCTIQLHKKTQMLNFRMIDYYDEHYNLKVVRRVQPWFLGNLLLGGLPGIILDVSTGSYIKMPDGITVEMRETRSQE